MELQQLFAERLLALLEEKNISQQEFAEKMGCSRQSINFYVLGKRLPDIALAGKMAVYLGVSCDYLIGLSQYRDGEEAAITVEQAGIAPDAMKVFGGLKILADGLELPEKQEGEKQALLYNRAQARQTLELLNALIAHDAFGVALQFIKQYRDLLHGEDELLLLKNFMLELESPFSGKQYGSKEENERMAKEFCLYVINQYLSDIIRDICK